MFCVEKYSKAARLGPCRVRDPLKYFRPRHQGVSNLVTVCLQLLLNYVEKQGRTHQTGQRGRG